MAEFESWVILELLGHRRLAGYLREVQVGGAAFLRLDVPEGRTASGTEAPPEDVLATQLYSAQAVYCITPTSETTAREVAQIGRPQPVKRWELPPTPAEYAPADAPADTEWEDEPPF